MVYHYAPGRGTEHARAVLGGVSGTIQVDGYAAYEAVARERGEEKPLVLAHGRAHGRRQLRELIERDGSRIAGEGLRRIAELCAVVSAGPRLRREAESVGLSPGERRAARQERTRPLVDAFDLWLDAQRARVSPKSRAGEKLAYFARHRSGLRVVLGDGRVGMDTDIVENAIRPQALTRRNGLFAGHDEGARTRARIASRRRRGVSEPLIETARLNGIEPLACLSATLEAIAAGPPQSRPDEPPPWAFQPASS